eukprot:5907844-Amphidinium_carterae.2
MVAQTSHVILRQLVVQIEGLQGVIRRERAGAPTMQLGLARASGKHICNDFGSEVSYYSRPLNVRLESVASDWVSPPKEDQADLYKALDITGLSVALEGLTGYTGISSNPGIDYQIATPTNIVAPTNRIVVLWQRCVRTPTRTITVPT